MENNKPLVSAIVPVYNTPEDYLWNSLDSILKQTYGNLEVLIVDDGSNNKLAKALDKYLEKTTENPNQKWQIIHQKNGGLSNARNNGFRKCSGEYVQFLDSDDLFDENLITKAMERAIATDADVVVEDFKIINVSDSSEIASVVSKINLPGQRLFSLRDIKSSQIGTIPFNVWSKLFKKSFLDNKAILHDESLHRAEDVLFSYSVLAQTDKITLLDGVYISYYEAIPTSNSARNDKYPIDSIKAWQKLHDLLTKNGDYPAYRESFESALIGSVYWHLERLHTTEGIEKLCKEFKKLAKKINIKTKDSNLVGITLAAQDVDLWRVYRNIMSDYVNVLGILRDRDATIIKLDNQQNPGIKASSKLLIRAIKRRIVKIFS